MWTINWFQTKYFSWRRKWFKFDMREYFSKIKMGNCDKNCLMVLSLNPSVHEQWPARNLDWGIYIAYYTITKYSITVQKHLKKRIKSFNILDEKNLLFRQVKKIYGATLSCELYIFFHEGKWKCSKPRGIKIFCIVWFKPLHELAIEVVCATHIDNESHKQRPI